MTMSPTYQSQAKDFHDHEDKHQEEHDYDHKDECQEEHDYDHKEDCQEENQNDRDDNDHGDGSVVRTWPVVESKNKW